MDRNQVIGFTLIFAILFVFTYFSKPSEAELAKRKQLRDSIALASKNANLPKSANATSAPGSTLSPADSMQASIMKDSSVTLENELIKVSFSSLGGKISKVELKKHFKSVGADNKEIKVPVLLLEDKKNIYSYAINQGGKIVNTRELNFAMQSNASEVKFTDAAHQVSLSYSLKPNSYEILHTVNSNGANTINLEWVNYLDKIEKGVRYEQSMSSVYYKDFVEAEPEYCSCTSSDNEKVTGKKINWISNTNQFFNSSIMSKSGGFADADLSTDVISDPADPDLKKLTSKLSIPLQNGSHSMAWYIGPNDFKTLHTYGNGLEHIIPYGSSIFGTINRWVIRPFFEFLNRFISSKGLVIILVIFLIKMLLYPLLYKTLHSQAKMASLKPELNKIKDKYKDDLQKQQMESMKIYNEFGVSPFSGCMPMFLQMPIWIALYRFFPSNITFRQESFLWAPDLSSYDAFISHGSNIPFLGTHISLFTLLWAISTVIYTYYSTKDVDMSANPAMKYVQYIMPLMFLGFFNSYASGLTCYMFFSNLINILQTIFTRKFLFDDKKIRAELEKQKANPKKKTGFMAKMEDAVKLSQKMAEDKAKNAKK